MVSKRFKTILVLLLTAAMLGSILAGCGSKGAGEQTTAVNATTTAANSQSTAVSEETSVYSTEPYEFSFYANYDWFGLDVKWGEDKTSQEIKNKFGITINSSKPDGDPIQKLNIMIASNDLPDCMMMDKDANLKKMIDLGLVMPLDDYIQKYPGYRSVVDEKTINLSKINGNVYNLLNWPTSEKKPNGNAGWAINEKIWKQLGSPEIKTLDDLFNYLKTVRDAKLMVEGKPVVPMQFSVYNFEGMWQVYYAFGGQKAFSSLNVYPVNNELKLYYTDPRYEQTMLFLNKLWNENLMNKDYFVEKGEQKDEKLATGRVAVYTAGSLVNDIQKGLQKWKEVDPEGKYKVIEPIAANGMNQADIKSDGFNTLGWNAIIITNKAKDPERIYQYFDWAMSQEGQTLLFYGPKGGIVYDEVDEKGYPVMKRSISSLSDAEQKEWGIAKWMYLGDTVFIDLSKASANEKLPEEQRDFVITNQANITWRHSANETEFVNIYTDPTSPEGIAQTAFNDYNLKIMPKMVLAKSEAEVKALIREAIDNAYKLGFEKVEDFMTAKWRSNLEAMKN